MTRDHKIRVAVSGVRDPAQRQRAILFLLQHPESIPFYLAKRVRQFRIGQHIRERQK